MTDYCNRPRLCLVLGVLAAASCTAEVPTAAPPDATLPSADASSTGELSAGDVKSGAEPDGAVKKGAANHDAMFVKDKVRLLRLTFTAAQRAKMQADMVQLAGEFGSGANSSGGGGGPGAGGGGGPSLIAGDPAWVEVTVELDGVKLQHAGVRYKGNSSLAFSWRNGIAKLPMRITFDKFEDQHPSTKNQRLHGFKKLTLAP